MATLIFLFSIVTNPASPLEMTDTVRQAPSAVDAQSAQSMRYYGVEKLLEKFELEA
jgi:hypothetical protein